MAKWQKDEEKAEKENVANGTRTLPQLADREEEWADRAIELLEMAVELDRQIGEEPDEKRGKEGSGMLRRLSEMKDEPRLIQIEQGLEGLRHNNLVFRSMVREGRSSLNQKQLRIELAERGVDLKVINEAFEAATGKGDPYWVRELKELE